MHKLSKRNNLNTMSQTGNLNEVGKPDAPIVIIADAPAARVYELGQVMSAPQMNLLKKLSQENGLAGSDFRIITPSPDIPEAIETSEKKIGEFLALYRDELLERVHSSNAVQLVVTLGKTALRQLAGRPVKITQARGSMTSMESVFNGEVPILPLLSTAHALRRPEVMPVFAGDFRQIAQFQESGWDMSTFEKSIDSADYEWCLDLQHLIDNPPPRLSLDTETIGLAWVNGRQAIVVVSITTRKGHAYVVPLHEAYFNDDKLRGESSKHLPKITSKTIDKLKKQLKELLANKSIRVTGHNLKFDIHHLLNYDIEIGNWFVDTMQLAFAVDDNMETKSLDECVRRWVSEMAGYADHFNNDPVHQSKSRMDLVPHDKMIRYAGGDTDACFRLTDELCKLCKKDARQWRVFRTIMMQGLNAFVAMERNGIGVDTAALTELGIVYTKKEQELYDELILEAAKRAPAVLRKHEEGGLRFSRDSFVSDLLFTKDGLNLTPTVFTPSTAKLPADQRIPSVSTKMHLPFFDSDPFVSSLIKYKKLQKLRSTYIGEEGSVYYERVWRLKNGRYPKAVEDHLIKAKIDFAMKANAPVRRRVIGDMFIKTDAQGRITSVGEVQEVANLVVTKQGAVYRKIEVPPSGFWQHLTAGIRLHPSFRLDATVTGRTSSQNPNAQNFPKRGPDAKEFRRIFVPRKGYVLIEADLSQAELRIAAWMANERNMLRIYREGGDIHVATGAGVVGISEERLYAGKKDKSLLMDVANEWKGSGHYLQTLNPGKRKTVTVSDYVAQIRQQAKAVNFGFLYGMWWKKFMDYAKTDYGVTFSPREAEAIRERFFALYPDLAEWHKAMKQFVNDNGYVRALHGALRRLPSILSDDEGIRKEVERQSVNSPVQRFASDIGVLALARFVRDCPKDKASPFAFIHDANIIEAREDVAEELAAALRFYMESTPWHWFDLKPPLPITSDVSIGMTLGEMEERPDIEAKAPKWYNAEADQFAPID